VGWYCYDSEHIYFQIPSLLQTFLPTAHQYPMPVKWHHFVLCVASMQTTLLMNRFKIFNILASVLQLLNLINGFHIYTCYWNACWKKTKTLSGQSIIKWQAGKRNQVKKNARWIPQYMKFCENTEKIPHGAELHSRTQVPRLRLLRTATRYMLAIMKIRTLCFPNPPPPPTELHKHTIQM